MSFALALFRVVWITFVLFWVIWYLNVQFERWLGHQGSTFFAETQAEVIERLAERKGLARMASLFFDVAYFYPIRSGIAWVVVAVGTGVVEYFR